MTNASELTIYVVIILYGAYYLLIAPYLGSKILMKTGYSERTWFFIMCCLIYGQFSLSLSDQVLEKD